MVLHFEIELGILCILSSTEEVCNGLEDKLWSTILEELLLPSRSLSK